VVDGRDGAGDAQGLDLDHGLEGVGTEGTLLLQGGADGGQFVIADGFAQEDASPLGAFGRGAATGQPDGVTAQPIAGAHAQMGLAGRP
jgi:hypothetical protein